MSVRARTKNKTDMSEDWIPTEADIAYAAAFQMPDTLIGIEAQKFKNYWTARAGSGATKRDWSATWRNWILNAMERRHDAAVRYSGSGAIQAAGRPMPSLPAWIASRVGALQTVNQRNPNSGKWKDMWTLPVSLILTETERREVQQHVDELRSLTGKQATLELSGQTFDSTAAERLENSASTGRPKSNPTKRSSSKKPKGAKYARSAPQTNPPEGSHGKSR